MKYIYEFADEEKLTCEVTEELAAVLAEMDRDEHANDEYQRSHTYSLENVDYEGEKYGVWDKYRTDEEDDFAVKLKMAFATLTPTQKRRLFMAAKGLTYREIADAEKINVESCFESIKAGRKKIKKFF